VICLAGGQLVESGAVYQREGWGGGGESELGTQRCVVLHGGGTLSIYLS